MPHEQPNDMHPNILFIMSDEHDPGVTGCYGEPVVETPNIDRLARQGILFDSCYTTSPLCVPARLSFTAGKYISRCSAWSNNCWLPSADYPSIARVLQSAGYETYLCGKQHYDEKRRYGFTDILPEIHSNRSRKTGRFGRRDADNTEPYYKSWLERSGEFYDGDKSRILDHDRAVTGRACRFLDRWSGSSPPFFLFVGHLAPHFPLVVPEEIHAKYRDRVPMPEIPEGFLEGLPLNYKQLRYGFGLTDCDPAVVKEGRELYWALTDWYDARIGQILDALDNSECADNTVVIYTSDHGENKGDHGLWWKNNMYEHSVRIPLIVRWPERWAPGQRRTQACSLVDVVQTLAGLAGAECPDDWNGDSMLPWLDDPGYEWKDCAVSEYYAHNISSGFAMLRTGPWKYVYHTAADENHPGEPELYNLENDPGEFSNAASDPAHAERIRAMHTMLVEELGEDPEKTEKRCRSEIARGYSRNVPAHCRAR